MYPGLYIFSAGMRTPGQEQLRERSSPPYCLPATGAELSLNRRTPPLPQQYHACGKGAAVGNELTGIDASLEAIGVEDEAVLTGGHETIVQHRHDFTQHIVDL
jgi:hypothetical protein